MYACDVHMVVVPVCGDIWLIGTGSGDILVVCSSVLVYMYVCM